MASVVLSGLWRGNPSGLARRGAERIVGPRAQAVGSLCTGAYRLSKRTTQRLLDDLFGCR